MNTSSKKTSKYLVRGLAACLLGANLLFNSGCFLFAVAVVGTAAAVGTVAYIDGKLETTLGNSYDSVVSATNKAITQLEFSKPEERRDALTDTFVTHTAKDNHVEIIVTKTNDNLTKISIRVDTLGDQPMSQMILDKIKSNL